MSSKDTLKRTSKIVTSLLSLVMIGKGLILCAQPGPPPFHQTDGLLSDLLDHNVSGSPNYNRLHYAPAWFTGETYHHSTVLTRIDSSLEDDSQNAAAGGSEPMNISKSPLGCSNSDYLPAGSTTRKIIWMEAYNGLSSHPNNGTDFYGADGGPTVNDMYQRGYDVCCLNWYWPNNRGQPGDSALNVLVKYLPNTDMKFCVGIDQQMLTANGVPVAQWQQCIINNLNHLNSKYFQNSLYEKRSGRPLVLFWDFQATISSNGANVNWDTIRAKIAGNPLFIFYQSGGFTATQSDGSFFWLNPDATDYATGGISYVTGSLASCAANPGKIRIPSVYCGFNGTKASWRNPADSWINRQAGLTYIQTWGAIKNWMNAGGGHGAEYVVDVTWDDDREGTGKFGGQRTNIRLQASLASNIVSFSDTGNEATVYSYNLWATSDNVHIMRLDTLSTKVAKRFDLTKLAVTPPAGKYTLYVQALSWPGLQNHLAHETFQVTFPLSTTTGMNETPNEKNGVSIYPNPCSSRVEIKTDSFEKQLLQLYDINGKLIISQNMNGNTSLDIGNLQDGCYMVSITGNNSFIIKKLVIVK